METGSQHQLHRDTEKKVGGGGHQTRSDGPTWVGHRGAVVPQLKGEAGSGDEETVSVVRNSSRLECRKKDCLHGSIFFPISCDDQVRRFGFLCIRGELIEYWAAPHIFIYREQGCSHWFVRTVCTFGDQL